MKTIMKQIYIIEHLEPKLFPWCMIEYKHISKTVGKSSLWFTNINPKDKNAKALEQLGKVINQSVRDLKLDSVCILDPDASQQLTPKDSKQFKYFIFGGILGDYPPKKRTKAELTQFLPGKEKRNIGKKQFSTDNAVYVTWKIANGESMKMMKFKNKFELPINKVETIILPYLYPIVNGKHRISDELIAFLKNKKEF
jgi:ribosome biogenesis SPOUT family RNA methylase Rps3